MPALAFTPDRARMRSLGRDVDDARQRLRRYHPSQPGYKPALRRYEYCWRRYNTYQTTGELLEAYRAKQNA